MINSFREKNLQKFFLHHLIIFLLLENLVSFKSMIKGTVLKVCSFHISIFITSNWFPPIYVISGGKVCVQILSRHKIPIWKKGYPVCAGTRRPDSRNSGLARGERTMVGVCPALGRTAQVIPAMHRPRPGTWVHVSRVPDVRVRTCGPVNLFCEYTSCHWQPLNCT